MNGIWQGVWSDFEEEDEGDDSDLEIGDVILLMESLTEKQRFVLELRYGLRDGEVYSQRAIADLMCINLSAVQGLEERALASLRRVVTAAKGVVGKSVGGNVPDTERAPHL